MKAACRALKLSIISSAIFMITTIILSIYFIKTSHTVLEVLLNISIGLLASSVVALLLNIPLYNVSKRQLLEKYWQEVKNLLIIIDKIDYLFTRYSEDNIVDYVHEMNNKKWREMVNKLNETSENVVNNKYKNRLTKEYIINNKSLASKISIKSMERYADEYIDKYIKRLNKKARTIYKQYVNVSSCNTLELSFLLGDMEFISGKKPYNKIYNSTYEPLLDFFDIIQEPCIIFKDFLNNHCNESIALRTLFNTQRHLFCRKKEENDEFIKYVIEATFLDKMIEKLEEFRADMYGIEPEKQNLYPVECIVFNKNID